MPLFIHLYRNKAGKFSDESGLAESWDEAMEWLENYHDSMTHAGNQYHETLMMVYAPEGREPSIAHRENMLAELPRWQTQQDQDRRAEEQHERAVRAGVRSASL